MFELSSKSLQNKNQLFDPLLMFIREISFFSIYFQCSGLINNQEDGIAKKVDADDVRPPLPVIRDVLYDNAMSFGYVIYHFCSVTLSFASRSECLKLLKSSSMSVANVSNLFLVLSN